MTLSLLMDSIGWLGAALVLSAYFLVSTRLNGDSTPFQWLNLVGGIGLLVNTLYYRAFPSSVVNSVWIFIAVVTIFRGSQGRHAIKQPRNDDL